MEYSLEKVLWQQKTMDNRLKAKYKPRMKEMTQGAALKQISRGGKIRLGT